MGGVDAEGPLRHRACDIKHERGIRYTFVPDAAIRRWADLGWPGHPTGEDPHRRHQKRFRSLRPARFNGHRDGFRHGNHFGNRRRIGGDFLAGKLHGRRKCAGIPHHNRIDGVDLAASARPKERGRIVDSRYRWIRSFRRWVPLGRSPRPACRQSAEAAVCRSRRIVALP